MVVLLSLIIVKILFIFVMMDYSLKISMNHALCLRDPDQTELGRKIVGSAIHLIHRSGFESFTFKKLADEIGTTEAGIYRYFENKHKLLVYLTSWYWSWLDFQIRFETKNIEDPRLKMRKVIDLLISRIPDDLSTPMMNASKLHDITINEGSKAYLTKEVDAENAQKFFKPYKDVCSLIGQIITEISVDYPYPRSLASTLIETSHAQIFFKNHLPSLTDFGGDSNEARVGLFVNDLLDRLMTP